MKMLIGGEPVDAASGETYVVRNPATGEEIDTVPRGGAADVQTALRWARKGRSVMAGLPAHRLKQVLVTEYEVWSWGNA